LSESNTYDEILYDWYLSESCAPDNGYTAPECQSHLYDFVGYRESDDKHVTVPVKEISDDGRSFYSFRRFYGLGRPSLSYLKYLKEDQFAIDIRKRQISLVTVYALSFTEDDYK
jgi:hypothetical protein